MFIMQSRKKYVRIDGTVGGTITNTCLYRHYDIRHRSILILRTELFFQLNILIFHIYSHSFFNTLRRAKNMIIIIEYYFSVVLL